MSDIVKSLCLHSNTKSIHNAQTEEEEVLKTRTYDNARIPGRFYSSTKDLESTSFLGTCNFQFCRRVANMVLLWFADYYARYYKRRLIKSDVKHFPIHFGIKVMAKVVVGRE